MKKLLVLIVSMLALVAAVISCGSEEKGPSGTAAEIADKIFAEAGAEPFGPARGIETDDDMQLPAQQSHAMKRHARRRRLAGRARASAVTADEDISRRCLGHRILSLAETTMPDDPGPPCSGSEHDDGRRLCQRHGTKFLDKRF